jgi:hypothetical protein
MFALADIMMHVEVAASFARQAVAFVGENHPQAEKTCVFSRVFANEMAQITASNILKIIHGTGVFDAEQSAAFLAEISHAKLADSYQNIIADMNRAADIIFSR